MTITTTFSRRVRRRLSALRAYPQRAVRAAGFPLVLGVEPGGTIAHREHRGSADLATWPPSMAEQAAALTWIVDGDLDAAEDLRELAGSEDRAVAVAIYCRAERLGLDGLRSVHAERQLERAFGTPRTWQQVLKADRIGGAR